MKLFFQLLLSDLRLHRRRLAEWSALVLFFIVIVVLLPFAVGPDAELLRRLGPGLIWLAVLLMSFLTLEKFFIADARDGTLDLMLLAPMPLPLVLLARLTAETCMLAGGLAFALIPATLLLDIDSAVLPVLVASLALGVPALVLLGGLAGAITAGLPRNPSLLIVLLAPFYIPVLIFSVAACDAAALGMTALPALCLLAAFLAVLMPAAPFVIAAALRNCQE
ncbi:MAG: heme exporter protein CcmB [Bdellovibrionales bacterium]